jgi:hypothetical protein
MNLTAVLHYATGPLGAVAAYLVSKRMQPLATFRPPAKLKSIRAAISTDRTTHLGSVLPAIESRRRDAQ